MGLESLACFCVVLPEAYRRRDALNTVTKSPVLQPTVTLIDNPVNTEELQQCTV